MPIGAGFAEVGLGGWARGREEGMPFCWNTSFPAQFSYFFPFDSRSFLLLLLLLVKVVVFLLRMMVLPLLVEVLLQLSWASGRRLPKTE